MGADLARAEQISSCLSENGSPFVRVAAVMGLDVLRMLTAPIEPVPDLEPVLRPLLE